MSSKSINILISFLIIFGLLLLSIPIITYMQRTDYFTKLEVGQCWEQYINDYKDSFEKNNKKYTKILDLKNGYVKARYIEPPLYDFEISMSEGAFKVGAKQIDCKIMEDIINDN